MPQSESLGTLTTLEHPARELALKELRSIKLGTGERVFSPGDTCSNYLIVRSGSIRVSVVTETGREIVLYRVEPGQTCVLTVSCLMSGGEYDADGMAEDETEAYILPKPVFDELMAMSSRFRQFVFASYGERLQTLISLVQEIAVKHVDRRLARLLISHEKGEIVAATHQAIAAELNTAREVVTRLLHDFSGHGWVKLERGRIVILQRDELEIFSRVS